MSKLTEIKIRLQAPVVAFRCHSSRMVIAILLLAGIVFGDEGLMVRRLENNPVIAPAMLPGKDGANINGPSLIRVPGWVQKPLGKYYLYFAHHGGKYIRLAYADRLEGPWKIKQGGVLLLADCPGANGHIASPDVIVDSDRKEVRMYFHGPAKAGGRQKSFLAVSEDGLDFKAREEILGEFYFRVFTFGGQWYALSKRGMMYHSKDGLGSFEAGPCIFPDVQKDGGDHNGPGPRHVAVHLRDDRLDIYYSSIGDAPERILRASAKLGEDWRAWRAGKPQEVIKPLHPWEGADLPVKPSGAGAAQGREDALRDPAIFVDEDRKAYLLYSVAGENGIAIAEVEFKDSANPLRQQ